MARTVALLVPDLMMRSKLSAMVTARGLSPWYARSVEKLDASLGERQDGGSARQVVGVVVDLNAQREYLAKLGAFLQAGSGCRSLGFFSHVTGDVGDEGRDLGCETVVPRSKLESVMPVFLGKICDIGQSNDDGSSGYQSGRE